MQNLYDQNRRSHPKRSLKGLLNYILSFYCLLDLYNASVPKANHMHVRYNDAGLFYLEPGLLP